MVRKDRTINQEVVNSWNYLLRTFTPEVFESMTFDIDLDKYVIGKGSQNRSFCYIVEVELKSLGDIRGANASKFGLWHDDINNKEKHLNPQYRATKKNFDNDVEKAFNDIKASIAKLIRESQKLKKYKELDFILGDSFKHKIMYLYNREIMIPSFVLEDIQHFEDCLGLPKSNSYEEGQNQLMSYMKSHHPRFTTHQFMNYLYRTYGRHNHYLKHERKLDDQLNEDVFDSEPYDNYDIRPVDKAKLKKIKDGGFYYPRDPRMAATALKNAKYKCENDLTHDCFIRRNQDVGYTEVHHLIPLAYHNKFDKSLDVPENIVSLCSNCHNEIHYGKFADRLIRKLFNERKEKLMAAEIDKMSDGTTLTIDKLLEMYSEIYKRK